MPEPVGPGAAGELCWRLPEAARVLVRVEKSWARLPELATAKKDHQNCLGQQAWFSFVFF